MKENKCKQNIVKLSTKIIYKRDGSATPFFAYKLDNLWQNLSLNQDTINTLMSNIESHFMYTNSIDTKELFKFIYLELQTLNPIAAFQYIKYHEADIAKFAKATDVNLEFDSLLKKNANIIHENANKDSKVFNTQRDLQAGVVSRALGLQMLPHRVARAHLRGDIHWHDLDYSPITPMTNCCLIDFDELLNHGYKIGNAFVEPPKSIQTATAQMAQIIANVASLQYGGCSGNRVDQLLAPFAAQNYKKHLADAKIWVSKNQQIDYAKAKTKKDIYDAMQALEYEINTLYSSQGQTPFTTINFGLGTDWLAREIQIAMLKIRINGLGKEHRTAIFPKLIFTLKRGLNLNPSDPNYDIKELAIECATKRMYPDLLMYEKIIELTGSFKTPMGCRSFLQGWHDDSGNEVNSGRMNLGVVTLNLPRISLLAHNDQALFWKILDEKLVVCHQALAYRIERTKMALPENAPLLYMYGAFGKRLKPEDSVDEVFKNQRATISLGYIGLYEVGTVFFGPDWENNTTAHKFIENILAYLRAKCDAWAAESGYHYSLYSTPAESLTDTFCRSDMEKFGVIENVTDKEYYTNSFHYDVRKHPSPFEKLTFESNFPQFASGGFIHYCEYPNLAQNPKALEAVWDWAYDKVGYLGTNTAIDKCFECGFSGEFKATARGFVCPKCGNYDSQTCDVVKRTCGYLGNPQQRPMVHGRHIEISSRAKNLSEEMIKNAASHQKTKQSDAQRMVYK